MHTFAPIFFIDLKQIITFRAALIGYQLHIHTLYVPINKKKFSLFQFIFISGSSAYYFIHQKLGYSNKLITFTMQSTVPASNSERVISTTSFSMQNIITLL